MIIHSHFFSIVLEFHLVLQGKLSYVALYRFIYNIILGGGVYFVYRQCGSRWGLHTVVDAKSMVADDLSGWQLGFYRWLICFVSMKCAPMRGRGDEWLKLRDVFRG